ncbi:MAG: 50S ribosomal protein L22 [Patescibacteria group bacterium]
MEVKAKAKHIRMSPRKVRLVIDAVRGLEVNAALDQLKFINKKAAKPVIKLLNSAVANAVNNFEIDKNNLKITEIRVDEGTTLHRWQPKAFGRATPIRKRSSHLNLVLSEIKASGKTKAKKKEIEAPIKLDKKPKEDEGTEIKKEGKKTQKADPTLAKEEKGKEIIDQTREGRHGHVKIEGGKGKGFASRIFRRKSG